jgi:hypothetical protein
MRGLMARLAGQTRDDRGVALFAAIAGMVLLSTMIAALVILARNENLIAQLNKDEAQAAYAAEAGANWGRRVLARLLGTDLPAKVFTTPRAAMKTALQTTYNSYNGGAQFIRDYANPVSGPAFVVCTDCVEPNYSAVGPIPDAQQSVLTLTCPGTTGCPANMAFTTRVIVGTHPTIPPAITNGGNGALFTYVWRIESSGTSGRARQQWVIHDSSVPTNTAGAFTIALNAEFVKYAHFIDQFQDAGGGNPWMSWRHIYTGPVHTNTRFSLLGNTSVIGQEGPTFRSPATQTQTKTNFATGGAQAKDSSAGDWPRLGPTPGILCKLVDCSGFTRTFDFDTNTPTIDPIPFPGGNNPQDRLVQACLARAVDGPACAAAGSVPALPPLCGALDVIVANNCTPGAGLTLNGGIWVNVSVTDLRLANIENVGQSIVIYTGTGVNQRRALIKENRPANVTTVVRECLKTAANNTPAGVCGGAGASNWNLDVNQLPNTQTFAGLPVGIPCGAPSVCPGPPSFSPNLATDYGLIFVNGSIGQAGTLNGLRRGDENGFGPLYAIYQNTGALAANKADGIRLTVVADGNVWITGPLNYRIDPRGPDEIFSDPIPGDPTGTSADDELDIQSVLGVVSWGTPGAGGIRLSSALPVGDLDIHGMVFVANLSNQAAPSGQFRFDDYTGTYRGISLVLGGVVQKTMGIFGQPSSNTGFERDWIYDERFRYRALSPPAFPGFPNFTGATSLGIDSYTWRLGLF